MRVSVLWLVSLVSAWCLLAPLTVVQAAAGSAGAESRGTATRTQADLDQQAQLQSTIHLDGESLVSQSPDYLSAVLPPLGGSAEPKLVTPADRFLAGPNFQPTAWSPLVGTQCKAFGAMGQSRGGERGSDTQTTFAGLSCTLAASEVFIRSD